VGEKHNIYLVQADILRQTPKFRTAYLPYGAGALWAYARQSPRVAERYALGGLFFLRGRVAEAAARMEHPFLVGFSCYCWNTEYNKRLAQAVKAAYPRCHILFGGHNVPPGGAMLDELPYVDFLAHGEGEIPFRALLEALCEPSPDFAAVPGLSWRAGRAVLTNADAAAESVADFPSPYLEGIFDPIVAAHPDIQWSTVWETNRGCPLACAYCDWGRHKAKVREFPMERIVGEIQWMCGNKVEYIWCADANFGLLPRDEDILNELASARGRTGYPFVFLSQTTKSPNERLFRIIETLNRNGLDRAGPDLAVQSMSPEVLRNIGRENMDDETFSHWLRRFRQAGYRTHTDLILGLPGESLRSYCDGVGKLFALGQHRGIWNSLCVLLPNSLMATPAYREKHGIRTTRRIFSHKPNHMPGMPGAQDEPEAEHIAEYIDTVTETAAMPHEDWRTANHFMFLAQGAHGYGLLRLAATYLHTENIVSYADFYLRLLDFCHRHPGTLPGETMAHVEQAFIGGIHGEEAPLSIPGFGAWHMAEDRYIFIRAVLEPERFYGDAAEFLRQFGLEPGLLGQLLRYQRESVLLPGAAEKTLEFEYDFPAYFSAIYGDGKPVPLEKRAVRLRFSFPGHLSPADGYFNSVIRSDRLANDALYRIEETR